MTSCELRWCRTLVRTLQEAGSFCESVLDIVSASFCNIFISFYCSINLFHIYFILFYFILFYTFDTALLTSSLGGVEGVYGAAHMISTQPCIPPVSLNRVSALINRGKGGNDCHLCRLAGNTVIPYGMWVPVAARLIAANCYTFRISSLVVNIPRKEETGRRNSCSVL